MTFRNPDRVFETAVVTGTGPVTLAASGGGAVVDFFPFSSVAGIATGDTMYVEIVDHVAHTSEFSLCTYTAGTNPTLTRSTPIDSSNGGASVSFAGNPCDIYVATPGPYVLFSSVAAGIYLSQTAAASTYSPLANPSFTGTISIGTNAAAGVINFDGPAGAARQIVFQSAGLARWDIQANATAESGSNAGSDLAIYNFNDAGNAIGSVLTVSRATGVFAFEVEPTFPTAAAGTSNTQAATTQFVAASYLTSATAATTYAPIFDPTFTYQVTVGLGTATSSQLIINSAVNTIRFLNYQSAGVNRWVFGVDSETESGSNAGSNFVVYNYSDSGSLLGFPMQISRATGVVAFGSVPTFPTAAVGTNNTEGATTALVTAAVGLDDPVNAFGLGAPAIIQGTVYAHKSVGVTMGTGNSQAVRAATFTGLQNAINVAASNGKFFEIVPGTYEIYGAGGLIVPISSASNGFVWKGSTSSLIRQFYANAPCLTVGDITGNSNSGQQFIDGFGLDYGVSQTGNTAANLLVLGAMAYSVIEKGNVCAYYGTNPPWIALDISCAGGSQNFFFQNVLRDINIGGGQQTLFNLGIGSTGSLFSNIYSHNGSSNSTRNVCSGNVWNLSPSTQGSDNIFDRCNIEHVTAASTYNILQIQNLLTTTFDGLHLEDVAIENYGAVFHAVGGLVKFINTYLLDLAQVSSPTGTAIVSPSGYGEFLDFDTLRVKWSSYSSGIITNSMPLFQTPSNNGNDTQSVVRVRNLVVEDDPGNNLTHVVFDTNAQIQLVTNDQVRSYEFDNILPFTDGLQHTVTANYTHYGQHANALYFVPASLSAAITITLSNKFKAANTGSSLSTPTGSRVRIRRQSGSYADQLTVVDAASSTTLTTNTTAAADYDYYFNGTNWVAFT